MRQSLCCELVCGIVARCGNVQRLPQGENRYDLDLGTRDLVGDERKL